MLAGFRAAWLSDGTARAARLDRGASGGLRPEELYLTDSGTSALTLALQVAHAATGAPVALPAYCCYDIATAADGAGVAVPPVRHRPGDPLARTSPRSGGRSRPGRGASSWRTCTACRRTWRRSRRWPRSSARIVIEDAAQGSGCEWRGRPAGAHGALGVLSFGRGKGVTGGRAGRCWSTTSASWRLPRRRGRLPRARGAARLAQGLSRPQGAVALRPAVALLDSRLASLSRPRRNHLPGAASGGRHFDAWRPGCSSGHCRWCLPRCAAGGPMPRGFAREVVGGSPVRPPPDGRPAGCDSRLCSSARRTSTDVVSCGAGVMRGYPKSLSALPGFGERRLNPGEDFPGARLLAERLVTLPTHRFVRSARIRRVLACDLDRKCSPLRMQRISGKDGLAPSEPEAVAVTLVKSSSQTCPRSSSCR